MTDDTVRSAWAYLAAVAEPPCAAVANLVAEVGPVEAAGAIRDRTPLPGRHRDVRAATEARHHLDCAVDHLRVAEAVDARLITPDDAEWPAWQLLRLSVADTATRGGPPLALWVRGQAPLSDVVGRSVALVGSRAASSYGEHVTARLSSDLVLDGWSTVSGGAYGIDGVAHRATLASGGTTVAVLACGIDRDYPAGHARLLSEIASTGLVITEYAPGTTAAKHRFLTRNRLVAALSSAVIVVEAGARSGAANTAAWARKLDVPLGAVPGPVTSATSLGCHRMIADGQAHLVVDAGAVSRLVAPDGGRVGDSALGGRPVVTDRVTDILDETGRRAHDAIPRHGAVTVTEIAVTSGLTAAEVRPALAMMEAHGLVVGDGSTWRLAAERDTSN
ncbi:DNA-processing protein DprA [Williamsia sterculiae]|uniref:DNA processing protein n=1 Tax=Williamsia sterculiae TaxID=1344003 RepID=A0A1N7GF57_9NOCA|nr:DNA-processing protein DprA [Williamsia sterculiae]SIS11152.1 DNA processing protein [Williamsia sterculiae]